MSPNGALIFKLGLIRKFDAWLTVHWKGRKVKNSYYCLLQTCFPIRALGDILSDLTTTAGAPVHIDESFRPIVIILDQMLGFHREHVLVESDTAPQQPFCWAFWRHVYIASQIRVHHQKCHYTLGSGRDSLGHEFTLTMQGLTKGKCFL